MSTRNLPGGVKGGRRVGLTISPPSMSWLSRKCRSLNVSQSYRPPPPITGIALPFFTSSEQSCLMKWVVTDCNYTTSHRSTIALIKVMRSFTIFNHTTSQTRVFPNFNFAAVFSHIMDLHTEHNLRVSVLNIYNTINYINTLSSEMFSTSEICGSHSS
jgi:hypothetical protein